MRRKSVVVRVVGKIVTLYREPLQSIFYFRLLYNRRGSDYSVESYLRGSFLMFLDALTKIILQLHMPPSMGTAFGM
jgi:hypothetical protein